MDMHIEVNGLKWSVSDEVAVHMQAFAALVGINVGQLFELMARNYLSRRGPNVQAMLRAAVAAYEEEQAQALTELKWAVFMQQTDGSYLIQHASTIEEAEALVAFTAKLSPVGHDGDWRRWPPIYMGRFSLDRLDSAGLTVVSWKRLRIQSDQYAVGDDEGVHLIKVDMFTPLG